MLENDIALLTLASPVSYTKAISPVCLPESSDSYANKDAAIVGWGTTSEGKFKENSDFKMIN